MKIRGAIERSALLAMVLAITWAPSQGLAVNSPTFTGIGSTSAIPFSWVTLNGTDLDHQPGSAGYQDVYYYSTDESGTVNGSANHFSPVEIRNNPANDGSIQFQVPNGISYLTIQIDACPEWEHPENGGCTSLFTSDFLQVTYPASFTGITPSSGGESMWVTLSGQNLSHENTGTPGYQTIYYGPRLDTFGTYSGQQWIAITDTSTIRDNPLHDGSIQVKIPSGFNFLQFHIDACSDWQVGVDPATNNYCFTLDSPDTYSRTIANVSVFTHNSESDTVSQRTIGSSFQLPPAPTKANFTFKEWNTRADGSGTPFAPATQVIINDNFEVHALWIASTDPLISFYIDAPLVQGSYASGSKVRTESFNAAPTTGLGTCSNSVLSVGTVVSGVCSIFDSPDFGASTISSDPTYGGSGSNMASNTSGPQSFEIQFTNNKKYVGFWWAAGSSGNQVEFLSGGQTVATMDVNQLFGLFGDAPNASDYPAAGDTIQAIGGSLYPKKYYFGNPNAYSSLTPVNISSSTDHLKYEPYVYIHAFADNGAYFDGIRFSGAGFELDNLTVSQTSVPIINRLVAVQSIEANAAALSTSEKIYFLSYHSEGSDSGVAPVDSSSPFAAGDTTTIAENSGSLMRSGFNLAGWNAMADGSGRSFTFGETITIADDLELYPTWQVVQSSSHQSPPPPSPPPPAISGSEIASDTKTIQNKIGPLETITVGVQGDPISETNTTAPIDGEVIPVLTPIHSLRKLGTIYFNNNEYFLDAIDRKVLTKISQVAKIAKIGPILIEGNTDVKLGVDNLWLSKARAESVLSFLRKLIPSITSRAIWFASNKPVAVGTFPSALAANRRVDIYTRVADSPESSIIKATPSKIEINFIPVTFNRNEYFLDAADRNLLSADVERAVRNRCVKISLSGSRDSTKGENNGYIAENRAKAVLAFMRTQYPALRFGILPTRITPARDVQISCTN